MTAAGSAEIVICGAGIAGIAGAYFLSKCEGIGRIVVVDPRPPLTLTSDKSTEAYRNWWPGPGGEMVRFMDHSIDLLEKLAQESGGRFHMNRRGYVYLSADPQSATAMRQEAEEIAHLGAGPLRVNGLYSAGDTHALGADLVTDPRRILEHFPFLAPDTMTMLHTRRCGWLSAQQLGMYLWEQARSAGVESISGSIRAVAVRGGRVTAVEIETADESIHIDTSCFVVAAGPYIAQVARLLGIDLPVHNELHAKLSFEDTEGIIDRRAPLMIWNDPIHLPWDEDERADLAAFEDARWMLDEFPPGLHFRPEGGPNSQTVLGLWPYHIQVFDEPPWPLPIDPEFVEIVMRGLTRMVPGLVIYLQRMARPVVDGGYYCKTRENRPLIGRLPVDGSYIIGALSGYGIMAAPAAAELLAAHITQSELPDYAAAFELARYEDPAYLRLLENWSPGGGQL